MKTAIPIAAALAAVMAGASSAAAEGVFSGNVLADAYWFAGHHEAANEDANGVWMRRVYLTYDVDQGDHVSMRFRLESGSPGLNAGKGKLEPFAKDAYLKWKPGGGEHAVYVGLSPTPTFAGVEGAWGYRSVEKTPVDLYRLGHTRDIGVGLAGALSEKLDYHVMIGGGNGTTSESTKGKKFMAAAGLSLTDDISLRGNFDFNDDVGGGSQVTAQALVYQVTDDYRWGAHFAYYKDDDGGNTDYTVNVVSGYATFRLGESTSLLGRVDMAMDENPRAAGISYLPMAGNSKLFFILVGLDYSPEPEFQVIPNVEFVTYDESGVDADLVPRLTFAYKF